MREFANERPDDPALEAELSHLFKLQHVSKWMRWLAPCILFPQDWLELFCPVCDELKRQDAGPFKGLDSVTLVDLTRYRVTVQRRRLRWAGGETYTAWVGQCSECRVAYWNITVSGRNRGSGPTG